MFPRRQNIRPRILWTLAFLGALLLLVNGMIIYSIRTSQKLLDQELGKRLQGTAHIAALLVQPAQFEMLELAVADTAAAADTALTDFSMAMDAQEAADAVRTEWKRLAQSAGLSNVILVDHSRRVLLRLRDPVRVRARRGDARPGAARPRAHRGGVPFLALLQGRAIPALGLRPGDRSGRGGLGRGGGGGRLGGLPVRSR